MKPHLVGINVDFDGEVYWRSSYRDRIQVQIAPIFEFKPVTAGFELRNWRLIPLPRG